MASNMKNVNIKKLLFAKSILKFVERILFESLKLFFSVKPDKKKYSMQIPENFYSPWINDNIFNQTYKVVKYNTFLDIYKLYELWKIVEQVKDKNGHILEVGAWRGGSACLIAKKCKIEGIKNKVFIADTFKGLVKTSPKDGTYTGGEHADTSVDIIKNLTRKMELDNTIILNGVFPDDTGKEIENLKFKFCHIDVDVYQSGKDIFNWIWGRMVIGGVVIFDDYGGLLTNGISRLVDDEYVKKDRIVFHNLNGHALMVKVL